MPLIIRFFNRKKRNFLENRRTTFYIVRIQALWRGKSARRAYRNWCEDIQNLQAVSRSQILVAEKQNLSSCAQFLQGIVLAKSASSRFCVSRDLAILIQSIMRLLTSHFCFSI